MAVLSVTVSVSGVASYKPFDHRLFLDKKLTKVPATDTLNLQPVTLKSQHSTTFPPIHSQRIVCSTEYNNNGTMVKPPYGSLLSVVVEVLSALPRHYASTHRRMLSYKYRSTKRCSHNRATELMF